MTTAAHFLYISNLQAGYINTVIYSCLATVKTFFQFFPTANNEKILKV